jgi:acetyl-CoA acetyltransferase
VTEIFVAGVGMSQFGRHLTRTFHELVGEALMLALDDAGCPPGEIGSAYFASVTAGPLLGQTSIPGPIALRRCGIEGIPMFSVENACAAGSSAFHLAAQALKAGACDIAIAIGAEKMNVPDKAKMFGVFDGGWDVTTVDANKAALLALGAGVEPPPGTMSERPYSVFMDVYAALCRDHMRRYGTTQRQIAAVAAKNHHHSVHNPLAQFRDDYSIEQILAAPPITFPLTLPMCSPISDGAAAAVLCTAAGLKRLNGSADRAVRLLASIIQTGVTRTADEPRKNISHLAGLKAYAQAGVAPEDVDVAEVHDATAFGEIVTAESLMLAPLGEAGPAALNGEFSIGGRIPINPSGGLESKGHPIGATGLGQIHELVTQLRGEAGPRQIEAARIAIQENGGGLYGIEEAVVAVNIFAKR